MNRVVAVIPIKTNNQRLPGKNTKILGGQELCRYLFSTVKEVNCIDETYVYCSDTSFQRLIPSGLQFLNRPSYLDRDEIKSKDILRAFIETVDADIYVLMHVTQPFISKKSIQSAIEAVKSGRYDSAFTAYEIREYAWFNGKTVNYSLNNVVRTQELEPIYTEGELYVFRKEVFTELGRSIGDTPFIQPINWIESVCIDTLEDFKMAEAVIAVGGCD